MKMESAWSPRADQAQVGARQAEASGIGVHQGLDGVDDGADVVGIGGEHAAAAFLDGAHVFGAGDGVGLHADARRAVRGRDRRLVVGAGAVGQREGFLRLEAHASGDRGGRFTARRRRVEVRSAQDDVRDAAKQAAARGGRGDIRGAFGVQRGLGGDTACGGAGGSDRHGGFRSGVVRRQGGGGNGGRSVENEGRGEGDGRRERGGGQRCGSKSRERRERCYCSDAVDGGAGRGADGSCGRGGDRTRELREGRLRNGGERQRQRDEQRRVIG